MYDLTKEMLISPKEFTETYYKRLQEALVYIKSNLIDTDGVMYLTVDSWIKIDNLITGLKNITLRKVNVKPYKFDKIYLDKGLIEDKLYQIIDQFKIQLEKSHLQSFIQYS